MCSSRIVYIRICLLPGYSDESRWKLFILLTGGFEYIQILFLTCLKFSDVEPEEATS
jgi:hypothetical protein